jgi:hypothetical protein
MHPSELIRVYRILRDLDLNDPHVLGDFDAISDYCADWWLVVRNEPAMVFELRLWAHVISSSPHHPHGQGGAV